MNPTNLNEWLAVATQNLASVEKQEIEQKIRKEFQALLLAKKTNGLSDYDAEFQARVELGNPQIAKESYCTTHFSLIDEKRIDALMEPSWWTRFVGGLGFLLIGIFIVFLIFNPSSIRGIDNISNQPQIIFSVITGVIFAAMYFLEPNFKKYFLVRQKINAKMVLVVQFFMIFLAIPFVLGVVNDVAYLWSLTQGSPFLIRISTSPIFAILAIRWVWNQFPLTQKAIRRLRA
jgi:hypothetical protein